MGHDLSGHEQDPDPLDGILSRIHDTNTHGPHRSADLLAEAGAIGTSRPDDYAAILVAAAAAPEDARQRGYRPARHVLHGWLNEARESDDVAILYPSLRLALSDLALRYGFVRQAYRELLQGLKYTGAETPSGLRHRLDLMAARINLASGDPGFARYVLDAGRPGSLPDNPCWLFMCQFVLAESYWLTRDYEEMDSVLTEASQRLEPESRNELLNILWFLKTWEELALGHRESAKQFLTAAVKTREESLPPLLRAEADFLQAVIDFMDGNPDAVVASSLQAARANCAEAAYPAYFHHLMTKALFLFDPLPRFQEAGPFIRALAQTGFDGEPSPFNVDILAARARLLRESGETERAAELFQRSLRQDRHLDKMISGFRSEWLAARYGPMPEAQQLSVVHTHTHAYYWTVIILVGILLLVAFSRIRIQSRLNQNLANAVNRAKRAEAEAEESNRLKSQFLANVSHEIKTPMSGLVGMASLLDELITDPQQRKCIGTIRTCSENMVVLLNDLLDLGRADSGKIQIEDRPFNPRELVGHCLELVRQDARDKPLQFDAKWEGDIPETIIGDGTRIIQVLTNLLNNALKFTDEGTVTVVTRVSAVMGASAVLGIEVRDTGIGIPANKLSTIFEPFSRVENVQVAGKEGGSGLGLAISRKLVELMGGRITVDSAPGCGSTFTVKIPVRLEHSHS